MSAHEGPPQEATAPPTWMQTLLGLVLKPDHQESVAGDLLEEYRETRRPVLGHWRADLWYLKQIAGFLWQESRVSGILLGSAFLIRFLWDVFVPTTDYGARATALTWVGFAIYLGTGLRAAWQTRKVPTAPVVAMATTVIGFVIAIAGPAVSAVLFFPGFQHDVAARHALMEAFDVPLPIMLLASALLGTIGGTIGKGLGGTPRSRTAS